MDGNTEKRLYTKVTYFILKIIQVALHIAMIFFGEEMDDQDHAYKVTCIILNFMSFVLHMFAIAYIFLNLHKPKIYKAELAATIMFLLTYGTYIILIAFQYSQFVHRILTFTKKSEAVFELFDSTNYRFIETIIVALVVCFLEIPLVFLLHYSKSLMPGVEAPPVHDQPIGNNPPFNLVQQTMQHLQNGNINNPEIISELQALKQAIQDALENANENDPQLNLPPDLAQAQSDNLHLVNVEQEQQQNTQNGKNLPCTSSAYHALQIEQNEDNDLSQILERQVIKDFENGEQNPLHLVARGVLAHRNEGRENPSFELESTAEGNQNGNSSLSYGDDVSRIGEEDIILPHDTERANNSFPISGPETSKFELPGHQGNDEESETKLQKRQPTPDLSEEVIV